MKKAFIIAAMFMQLAVNGMEQILDSDKILDADQISAMVADSGGVLTFPDDITVIRGRRGERNPKKPDNSEKNVTSVEFGENSQLRMMINSAFWGYDALKSIRIPDSVTTLGVYCFLNCFCLENVYFGRDSRISVIGEHTFYGCHSLKDIHLPSSVTTLGEFCFGDCLSLENVHLDENPHIVNIGRYAFWQCYALESAYIPSGIETLGDNCFALCHDKLKYVHFGKNTQISVILSANFYWHLKFMNFGLEPEKADRLAAIDWRVPNPELEPIDVPEEVKPFYDKFYAERLYFLPCKSVGVIFIPLGIKFFSNDVHGVRVDNSTPGDDFIMVWREKKDCIFTLKALRIRD
ncbi:MAG: leucine-rich repeat domain-containing protein [Holosporaceae bacterium]|nr:leucine-rich repeat domain-containing protein [Holosporaceae bacterium]